MSPAKGSYGQMSSIISSPFRSLIAYVHGTVFLILLITKISADQFGVYLFSKNVFVF